MRYYVTAGSDTWEVVIDGARVTVNGQAFEAKLTQVPGTPLRHLSVNGASHRVVADQGENNGEWLLHLDGFRLECEVIDERTRSIRAMTSRGAVSHGPKPVRAPMPGLVVRVEVNEGDHVKAGQGVVIIEAMKMENELKAEVTGVVKRVLAREGTAVEKGAVLVEFADG